VVFCFGSPFTFTGELLDANDLLYLRARYYSPALGVFTALDPVEGDIAQAMSLNRYGYVAGNVVNAVDPSGMIYEPLGRWDKCAQQENNCVYQCLMANPEWLQIVSEAEINRTRPEDMSPETFAAIRQSYYRFQECVRQYCNVTYIGGIPYVVAPITPPLFADSEYPPRCEGAFPSAESCMSAQL
jgi:RHS repeat-associated protein